MALVPVYCWKLGKDGRPKVDAKGNKIPHPKQGQRKVAGDWSKEEKRDHDRQLEHFDALRRLSAERTVEPIHDAERVLGEK
jgi:hypothetical protein